MTYRRNKKKKKGNQNQFVGNVIIILLILLMFWRFGAGGQFWEYTRSKVNDVEMFDAITEMIDRSMEESITYIDEWKTAVEVELEGKGENERETVYLQEIPEYTGEIYVELNDNIPGFTQEELSTTSYERYSELDALGRCGVAVACIGSDIMPTEERTSISSVTPSGWENEAYDFVDGTYLYNRCHLIGFQLTGENANENNLITGTRSLNVEGMLPWENMVAEYVKSTNNHVMYRVTPIFEGDNLLASGVQMEAFSVEDEGVGISFHIFVYNVEEGVVLDYSTGLNEEDEDWLENVA